MIKMPFMKRNYCIYQTPLGDVMAVEENGYLIFLGFDTVPPSNTVNVKSPLLKQLEKELTAYFNKTLSSFSIPIKLNGTHFQQKVWQALQTIPYGETISYQELACRIGHPQACRAVGMANHHNPVSIIVPCHRVIGKSGKLIGYGGGLDKKEFLLKLEKGL